MLPSPVRGAGVGAQVPFVTTGPQTFVQMAVAPAGKGVQNLFAPPPNAQKPRRATHAART